MPDKKNDTPIWYHCTNEEGLAAIKKAEILRLGGCSSIKYDGILAAKPWAPRGVWFEANYFDGRPSTKTVYPLPQRANPSDPDPTFYRDSKTDVSHGISVELSALLPSLHFYDLTKGSPTEVNYHWTLFKVAHVKDTKFTQVLFSTTRA